jgi:predicted ATPase
MINTLEINRFKSIKSLTLDCRKFNLFIGEPNTGKSNILEALGLWSFLWYGQEDGIDANEFFRFETTLDLFYDAVIDEPLQIRCDDLTFSLSERSGRFRGSLEESNTIDAGSLSMRTSRYPLEVLNGSHSDVRRIVPVLGALPAKMAQVKFYRFRVRKTFDQPRSDFLLPPSGDNLLSLLVAHRELRTAVNDPFRSRGLGLGLRPQENKIEVIKSLEDDIIISHPYSLASETFQRLTFYQAAILSNHDSVLVFEEPESHSFPYHTKYLAEQIALDENENQYFIATHNPYFLLPVLEKAKKEDVAVHIVYYEDYQTKTRELAPDDLAELAEVDVFTNLERYLSAQ